MIRTAPANARVGAKQGIYIGTPAALRHFNSVDYVADIAARADRFPTVLVVEDLWQRRPITSAHLRDWGFHVLEAAAWHLNDDGPLFPGKPYRLAELEDRIRRTLLARESGDRITPPISWRGNPRLSTLVGHGPRSRPPLHSVETGRGKMGGSGRVFIVF